MKLARHSRTSWTFWQSIRLLENIEKYLDACKTIQDMSNFRKWILELQVIQETFKNHRKIFWSLQDIPVSVNYQESYIGTSETSLFYVSLLSQTELPCSTQEHSLPHETFFPKENALSHMRLLYPIIGWYFPHETTLCHIKLVCPILYWFVPHDTALFQIRLTCPTWDCSVPH